jgi:hypothetical protein
MNQKPTVLLYEMAGVGLIFPYSSGVVYQNQTGGYACLQSSVEGIFVPLQGEPFDHYKAFHTFFFKGKWAGNCANGIDGETADFIDATLARLPGHSGIKVDRSRLAESHEAWVHVTLADPTCAGLLEGFNSAHGILTWSNSD